MKQKIVFATNNAHKLEEVAAILGDSYEVLSLREIGCDADIPETADTFAGNALQKARYVKEHYGYDCFADDSGLEVDALDGAPGVYSARYSGGGSEANMDKLLHNLTGKSERGAQFRTVIALLIGEDARLFEGFLILGCFVHADGGTRQLAYTAHTVACQSHQHHTAVHIGAADREGGLVGVEHHAAPDHIRIAGVQVYKCLGLPLPRRISAASPADRRPRGTAPRQSPCTHRCSCSSWGSYRDPDP